MCPRKTSWGPLTMGIDQESNRASYKVGDNVLWRRECTRVFFHSRLPERRRNSNDSHLLLPWNLQPEHDFVHVHARHMSRESRCSSLILLDSCYRAQPPTLRSFLVQRQAILDDESTTLDDILVESPVKDTHRFFWVDEVDGVEQTAAKVQPELL